MSLFSQIKEDWIAHNRDWTRAGFRAVATHRFGVWRMTVEPKPLRAPLSIAYRALYRTVRNLYGIELPYSAKIGRRVIFEHQHGIVVHGQTVIGDDCIIRQGVTLGIRSMERLAEAPVLGAAIAVRSRTSSAYARAFATAGTRSTSVSTATVPPTSSSLPSRRSSFTSVSSSTASLPDSSILFSSSRV